MNRILFASILIAGSLNSQTLNVTKLGQPPTDTWPMYNGDYSGRRSAP